MPLTLLTGPHQSGKSRRLWQLLRAEAPGSAVLVRTGGMSRDLVRQAFAWGGPGWLPAVMTLPELAERAAAAIGDAPAVLSEAWIRHALRRWAVDGLTGTVWEPLAVYRRTARELTDLLQRLDAQLIQDADLTLAKYGDDEQVRGHIRTLLRARAWLRSAAARRRAATAGARWMALHEATLPWASVYVDDILAMTPAEVAWLAAMARTRRVVVAAIVDDRCPGGLAERLRIAVPGADEEHFSGIHAQAPHSPGVRALLQGLLPPDGEAPLFEPAAVAALGCYRYRDPVHAGRAMAAWLTARSIAPGQVNCYVRVADGDALALADALLAAGIPVSGRFSVAFGATAAGATVAALGAWLSQPTWSRFRDLALRLSLATPVPVLDLVGPWHTEQEAFTALTALATTGEHGDLGIAKPLRADLATTVAMLRATYALLPQSGGWLQRLNQAAELLALPIAAVATALAALEALHPVDLDDLIDALANMNVEVERKGGPQALLVLDAVRGRSQPRAIAVIHGLEHGVWPPRRSAGILLSPEDQAMVAAASSSDWFDEVGRVGGEVAALLACAARGLTQLVIGIPCGERQASGWLATLAEQAGWDLEALRAQPDAEAVAGAPFGPADSLGAAEQALWSGSRRQASLQFRVPPRAPSELGLRVSSLDRAIGDSFACVCDRLALGDVLTNRAVLDDGHELHALLSDLAHHPPTAWPTAVESLLAAWLDAAPDALERAARQRRALVLRHLVDKEATAAAGSRIDSEQKVKIALELGKLGTLILTGRADRIDHLPDGTTAVVDYKRGRSDRQRQLVKEQREAQVTAYLIGLRQAGATLAGGAFVTLADGKRVAVDLEGLEARWSTVLAGISSLAEGTAVARVKGSGCPATVIRALECSDLDESDEEEA